MTKKELKQLDQKVADIYRTSCSGIQIPIMEVSKVMAVGRQAAIDGKDIREAIVAYVETIRVN